MIVQALDEFWRQKKVSIRIRGLVLWLKYRALILSKKTIFEYEAIAVHMEGDALFFYRKGDDGVLRPMEFSMTPAFLEYLSPLEEIADLSKVKCESRLAKSPKKSVYL